MITPNKRTALIDLGTNSLRLLIVELRPDNVHTIIREEKSLVRLGEGAFSEDKLSVEAMERTAAALEDFVKIAEAFKVDQIRAVATAATREAVNKDEFLDLVWKKTGLKLRIISGREEARLIYLGISKGISLGDKPSLLIDIGGGSTEIVVGDQNDCQFLDSLPLGSMRLTGQFNLLAGDGVVTDKTYQQMVQYAVKHSQRAAEAIKSLKVANIYGSSGTISNLSAVYQQNFNNAALDLPPPPPPLSVENLSRLGPWLGAMPLKQRRKVPGISNHKADILVAGSAILEGLFRSFAVSGIVPVARGLKHGLVWEFLNRENENLGKMSVREASIRNLGRRCHYDEEHCEKVALLALNLLEALTKAGLISPDTRDAELLRFAALVHDVGNFLSFEGHNRHSWYLIKNADLLGFDEDEIELMAFLALNHRKKKKRETWPPPLAPAIKSPRQAEALFLIMRIAEGLESGHRGLISDIKIKTTKYEAIFTLAVKNLEDISREIQILNKLGKDFSKCFGLDLIVAQPG